MAERYKNIINNIRKGIIDRGELGSLEMGFDQMMERIHFYENLIKERDEHIENLNSGIKANNLKISDMQSHIDCLKAELAEVQRDKVDLPAQPIKVADMLINANGEYETSSIQRALGASEKETYDIYAVSDLRQIAEHLLVYCNNAEVGQ